MSEAAFSITVRDSLSNLNTVRGDTYENFVENLQALLGNELASVVLSRFRRACEEPLATAPSTETEALNVIKGAFPQSQVLAQPQAVAAAEPPVGYPGDCQHGRRIFKDSIARGAPWRRWDCALPFSEQTKSIRCRAVNL